MPIFSSFGEKLWILTFLWFFDFTFIIKVSLTCKILSWKPSRIPQISKKLMWPKFQPNRSKIVDFYLFMDFTCGFLGVLTLHNFLRLRLKSCSHMMKNWLESWNGHFTTSRTPRLAPLAKMKISRKIAIFSKKGKIFFDQKYIFITQSYHGNL